MDITQIKKALLEVQGFCETYAGERFLCDGCPFQRFLGSVHYGCRLKSPDSWVIDDWKEDSDAAY